MFPDIHAAAQEMAEQQPPRFAVHPMRVIFMARAPLRRPVALRCEALSLFSFSFRFRFRFRFRFSCSDFAGAAAQAGGRGRLVAGHARVHNAGMNLSPQCLSLLSI
jgi:hypothetical protein